jgi:hypothetical protein
VLANVAQQIGELTKSLESHSSHDGILAFKVTVKDWLTELDSIRQSASGHGFPAFGLG